MATPNELASPPAVRTSDRDRRIPRSRKRSPSLDSDRKRHRVDSGSPRATPRSRSYNERPGWERERYEGSRMGGSYRTSSRAPAPYSAPYPSSYDRHRVPPRGYENGYGAPAGGAIAMPMYHQRPNVPVSQVNMQQQTTKSKRLYIGNIPFQAGLTDVALTQFFSAMYVAGFRANRPGESLPVVSFWLHSDGKFGFMELRGEQEAVNMMQFNGVFLHGRPLRVNRPSDYRPELHNPSGMNLVPDAINIQAIIDLCDQLGGVVAAPAQLTAIAAAQAVSGGQGPPPPSIPPSTAPNPPITPEQVPSSMPRSQNHSRPSGTAPVIGSSGSEPKSQEPTPGREKRVISLRNLVTNEDLDGDDEEYQELLDDVQAECAKYGKIQSLNIPRTGVWKGTAFVEFSEASSVGGAVDALSKRVFDNRQIEAVVIDNCQTAAEAADRPKRT